MKSAHVRPHCARTRLGPWWPVVALSLLGAGCAAPDVPVPDRHAASGQKTLRAVHHWDVLADAVATRMADRIRDWPAGEYPIYVKSTDDTRFSQGFRKLLMNHLADRGIVVTTEATAVVQLVIEAQVVQHLQPGSGALEWVPLASGVSVARDGAHFHGAHSFRRPAGDAEDLRAGTAAPAPVRRAPAAPETPVTYPPLGKPERSEVLVTASLESAGRFLAGTADVYSLVHDDALLFLPAEPRLPSPGPAPVAIKTWRVVAP
jgi:hypothetical protein